MEKQEKVVISATEPEVVAISIDRDFHDLLCQCCLLCNSSRPFVNGYPPGPSPWVCEECKEAIAFIKDFKSSIKQSDSNTSNQSLPKVEIVPL